ncbi:MAG: primosomal protein N' [Propionibacteriaceae bacterium]|nr:primosomal protein N' [Propionibacteriaceae bacterium]
MESAALFDAPTAEQVAKVAVDVPLAHLDQLFDYRIPEKLAASARPGVRVTVPFSGQVVDGWLVRLGSREAGQRLAELRSVVSPEPVLSPAGYDLIRGVADHYAGTWWDVARLAIPPRQAGVEKQPQRPWPAPRRADGDAVLTGFPGGKELLAALTRGTAPRAFWQVPCVADVAGDLVGGVAEAVSAVLRAGRSALVLVPTNRAMMATAARLEQAFGPGTVAVLSGELGRATRYENYLACSRGQAKVLVGTQSAAFTPMQELGLIVVVDDGNGNHSFERFPRPHVRAIATLRAIQEGCALLFCSHARSCEAQDLIERGWLRELALTPPHVRRLSAPVRVISESQGHNPSGATLRLPSGVFEHLRAALASGPVLVSVARAGYAAGLRCDRCRSRALCPRCHGPLIQPRRDRLECTLCGHTPVRFECPHCHSTRLRAPVVGSERTADELGRAFPGVRVINSSAERVRSNVPADHALVIATPGGEPTVSGGYAAALILDAEQALARADLRVGEESMRRWCQVLSLVRPAQAGGTALLVGPREEAAVQALVRADPGWFAARELADRRAAGLPPAVKAVQISGDSEAVAAFLDNSPFAHAEVLGPTLVRETPQPESKALLRCPLEQGRELVTQVKAAAAIRSARKEGGRLFVQVDPMMLT